MTAARAKLILNSLISLVTERKSESHIFINMYIEMIVLNVVYDSIL